MRCAGATRSNPKGLVAIKARVASTVAVRLQAPRHRARVARKRGKPRIQVYPAFTSPAVAIRVNRTAPQIVTLSLPKDLCTLQEVTASAGVSPARGGSPVQLQISDDDGGSWDVVAEAGQSGSGKASVKFVGPEVSGTYHYRAVVPAQAGLNAGGSDPVEVEVRPCVSYPPLPQIYAGGTHSCSIDARGETWCWGGNEFGEVGDGTNEQRTKPVKVSGNHDFVDLALGSTHTCGLVKSGKAYCWGDNGEQVASNSEGALGDGSETDRNRPTAVSGGHSFVKLTAGSGYSCGITTGGSVYCWGYNAGGQLGDGSTTKRTRPTRVSGGGLDQISAHSGTCGLDGGALYCWANAYRHLTDRGAGEATTPARTVDGNPTFTQISTGGSSEGGFACGVGISGTVYCAGNNGDGRLGRGFISPGTVGPNSTEFEPVVGYVKYSQVHSGQSFSCALTVGDTVNCWGLGSLGSLGRGESGGYGTYPTPEPVAGGHNFKRLAVGYGHSCAIDTGGFAWCWGTNAQGQIGNGNADLLMPATQPNTVLFPGVGGP